jgi:hypothetical protein
LKSAPLQLLPQSALWAGFAAALVAVAFVGALALARAAVRTLWAWADERQRTAAPDFTINLPEHARFLASASQRDADSDDSARSGRREGSVAAAVLEVLPRATEARGPVDRQANAASGHPAPTPEDATLKRKGAAENRDPVERLKKKAMTPQSEIQRRHEATVLKAKLAKGAKPPPSKHEGSSELAGGRATPNGSSGH